MRDDSTIQILGVKIHCVNFAQTLEQITAWVEEKDPPNRQERFGQTTSGQAKSPVTKVNATANVHQICTVNPEFIMAAQRDPSFADVLRTADLCVPDGIGVLWAARRQGVQLSERVTGSDGIYRICERAAARGWRVFLLGAAEGVAAEASRRLARHYPKLQVVGTYSGSPDAADWPAIAQQLHTAQPDILFVAYGHPQQDIWIAHHRHELPVKVALGIGGAFDFVAGITPRAPQWMQRAGIEWLHRLLQQPWRWRRMVVLPLFVWHVLWQPIRP